MGTGCSACNEKESEFELKPTNIKGDYDSGFFDNEKSLTSSATKSNTYFIYSFLNKFYI